MMSISSTHDFNVIHTRYQCYTHKMSNYIHKISMLSTQNINVTNIKKMSSTQDINVIHTKYKCHPHLMSISSTHDFNVIHMRYQCYPHKMSNYIHKISMSPAQDKQDHGPQRSPDQHIWLEEENAHYFLCENLMVIVLHLTKLKFPSPKHALCQVWLKSAQ